MNSSIQDSGRRVREEDAEIAKDSEQRRLNPANSARAWHSLRPGKKYWTQSARRRRGDRKGLRAKI